MANNNLPDQYRDALNELNESQLIELNKLIVVKTNFFGRARQFGAMMQFNAGDRVCFMNGGQKVFGYVERLNQKSVSLRCDDGGRWKVAPSLLEKVDERQKHDDNSSDFHGRNAPCLCGSGKIQEVLRK
jgi:hypothetical protein